MDKQNSIINNISVQDFIDVIDSLESIDIIEIKSNLIRKLSPAASKRLLKELDNINLNMKNNIYIYKQCLPTIDDYFDAENK